MKKKLLFIGHGPLMEGIRTRGEELANRLAKKYDVYYLSYKYKYSGNILLKGFFRIFEHFFKIKKYKYKNFKVIEVPKSNLYSLFSFKRKKFSKFSYWFNKRILKKIIKKYSIDFIFSEALDNYDVSNLGIPYIYDIVDFNPSGEFSEFLRKQVDNAALVTVISKYIQKKLWRKSVIIPNGVDIKNLRKAKPLKKNKKVKIIGFIGNHDWWSGLIFLIKSFSLIKKPFVELWIIGGGNEIPKAKKYVKENKIKNVKFIGKIPKDKIYRYYKTIDLGVLPFDKNELTDAALPLKILEYTAAKKIILATDLEELKRLKFSNLYLLEQNEEKWAKKMKKLLDKKWNNNWNEEIKKFSWDFLANKLINEIKKVIR